MLLLLPPQSVWGHARVAAVTLSVRVLASSTARDLWWTHLWHRLHCSGNGSHTMLCIRISWSSYLVLSFSSPFSLCHLSNLGWREKPSSRTRILKDLVNNLGYVSWGNFCLSQPPTPKPALFQVWPFTLKNCCRFCVDIQVLMGSLVYLRQGIENSPYVHLLDANQWADICDIFTRDACALLGLSVESPLSVRYGDWSCC